MLEKKILIVDNDQDFLNTRAEFLENEGYKVILCSTLKETQEVLEKKYIDLMVLDIRMVDDDDEKDISGVTFAKESLYRPIPKIILTNFPSYQTVRDVLGPVVEGTPAAVQYIGKKEGPEALINEIKKVYDSRMVGNRDLHIRSERQNQLRMLTLAHLIVPNLPRELVTERANEIEGLFQKLFFTYKQLTLGRILARRDQYVLISVFAYSHEELEEQYLLVIGLRDIVKTEKEHYEEFSLGRTKIAFFDHKETIHFGGSLYRLQGRSLAEIDTFSEAFHQRSTEVILASLDDLYGETLAECYQQGIEKRDQSLEEFLRADLVGKGMDLTKEKWEARWKRLCQDALQSGVHVLECSPRRLRVSAQDSQYSYPNPAPYFYEERITISPPTLYGIVHGHLDGDSVLVDRAGNTWVIDFTMTGRAPLLMDYVSLENAVKFDILPTLSLVERHEIERRLLDMEDLYDQQGEEGLSLAAKKAFQVIVRIRNRAADVMGEKLKPYLVALIFSTLERFSEYCPDLRYTKQETTLFSHMLLVMGMITQNLFGWEDRLQELPCQAETSLWLDEAHQEVWVEGRCIALAPQRFKLLKYLYDHANQPCNREELASQVYEMDMESFLPPDRKRLEKDTINTNIGRLRKDIEPNPQYPKYIKTVRGVGYELVLPVVSGNGD